MFEFHIPALESTQPPVQWVPGALSPGVRQPVCKADHLPVFSAELKNVWSYTSISSYLIMVRCLVKQRENFIFTLQGFITWIGFMWLGIGTSAGFCEHDKEPLGSIKAGSFLTT
jgi:hypothetical protein